MIGKIFRFGDAAQQPPAAAPGERVYAIGDVHGCYAALRKLLSLIEEHSNALPRPRSMRLILLGDVIDRGPCSREVVHFLRKVRERTSRLVVLRGNHEDMLLRVLDREIMTQRLWLRSGGDATLRSFGVSPLGDDEHPQQLADRLRAAMGAEVVDWLRTLPLSARSGDYLFVHAGIRPGVRLKRQQPRDMLWIRDDFLDAENRHGPLVVHGHSISFEAELRSNRIGIDTGAYRTGRLSALYVEGTKQEIISTLCAVPEA